MNIQQNVDDMSCTSKTSKLIQWSAAKIKETLLLYCRARKGSGYESKGCNNIVNTQ